MATATQNAMGLSIFIMCLSFGITMFNTLNIQYEQSTGTALVQGEFVTSFVNASDFGGLGSTKESLNETMNDMSTFIKPDDVGTDFYFFQGIKIFRIMANILILSTWGIPIFLNMYFGMPALFVVPMLILINLSHVILLLKLFAGKEF